MFSSYKLIIMAFCLLMCGGSDAIDMHFSASGGGGSYVSIWDHYDVDDSCEVNGKSSAGFDNGVSMSDTRSVSGPGDIDVFQRYSGSDGYIGWNGVYIQDGSETVINSNAYVTPETLTVGQDVSSFDAEVSEITFGGESGGLKNANQRLVSLFGSMDSRQIIGINDHVYVFQDSNIDAEYGSVYSLATDSDGKRAGSDASVDRGTLNSILVSEAGNSVIASQKTNIEDAEYGYVHSFASDSDGTSAGSQASIDQGTLSSVQVSEADDSVKTFQNTNIEDAEYGFVHSFASDSDGTSASSQASVDQGTLSSVQISEADNSVKTFQNTNIEDAEYGFVHSFASDSDGTSASSHASVDQGTLSSILVSEAGNSARAFQNTNIVDAEYGIAQSHASDVDGIRVLVSTNIVNGKKLSTTQTVESDDGLRSRQSTVIEDAEEGESGSWAMDAGTDNYVGIGVRVYDGSLSATNLKSENHDGILSTSGETSLDTGDWGYTWADAWIGRWEDPDCKVVQLYSQVSKGSINTRNLKSELNLGKNVLKASGEVDLVTADEGFASDSAWYGHDSSVGVRCHVSDGTFSADLRSEEDADRKVLTASGEAYITPLGLGGHGYAVAGTSNIWVDENVNYGETLHAAMNSEMSESGESARVDVL